MRKVKVLYFLAITIFLFSSCNQTGESVMTVQPTPSSGVYVVNKANEPKQSEQSKPSSVESRAYTRH